MKGCIRQYRCLKANKDVGMGGGLMNSSGVCTMGCLFLILGLAVRFRYTECIYITSL